MGSIAFTTKTLAQLKSPTSGQVIVFDNAKDAPTGFALRLSPTTRTYIVKRRFGPKTVTLTVGKSSDFATIDLARDKARDLSKTYETHGVQPKKVQRTRLDEQTLEAVLDDYEHHLRHRATPARPNTLAALAQARKRLQRWAKTPLKSIDVKSVLSEFTAKSNIHRTATEQAFTWGRSAVNHAMAIELMSGQPTLSFNPFMILSVQKSIRSKASLEKSYAAKKVRNPMKPEAIEAFLRVLWVQRNGTAPTKRTSADYLLLTLLLGTRANEANGLQWKDRMTADSTGVDANRKLTIF